MHVKMREEVIRAVPAVCSPPLYMGAQEMEVTDGKKGGVWKERVEIC